MAMCKKKTILIFVTKSTLYYLLIAKNYIALEKLGTATLISYLIFFEYE